LCRGILGWIYGSVTGKAKRSRIRATMAISGYDFDKVFRKIGRSHYIWSKLKKLKPQFILMGLGK